MIYRGFALVISGGAPASVRLPDAFYNVTGARTFLNLPVPALWFLAVTFIAGFILHKTSYGFKVYATGGNEEAARLSGIHTDRIRITNFVLIGVASALASIIQMAYLRGVTPPRGRAWSSPPLHPLSSAAPPCSVGWEPSAAPSSARCSWAWCATDWF